MVPFAFEDSLVRVRLDENGNPWFVAKDVCRVLELGNPRSSLALLEDDEKGVHTVDTLGGPQEMAIVSESGLYALIFRSRKPRARRIRKWVTSEVLPALRKTGGYAMPGSREAAVPAWLPLPPEALALRPNMRERLWNDAMQAARLDNTGTEAAVAWFAELCRMMIARTEFKDKWRLVYEFMDERLLETRGHSERLDRIYAALRDWWKERSPGVPLPGVIDLSRALRESFRAAKSNVTVFRDCLLLPENN
jgi:hypothetical protein